jgi:predicted nucleic acid-binding protein
MKLLVVELGSENMIAFAESVEGVEMVVSALCRVEATSTISRLRKGRRILPDEAVQALDLVEQIMASLAVQPITTQVLDLAANLAEKRCLRALDAVQLASAITARDQSGTNDMRLVASDKELLEAAQKEGFATWNPCD